MDGRVLVAGRERSTCEMLAEALFHDGFAVDIACDRAEALVFTREYDVVIADLELDLLSAFKAQYPTTEVVVVTCETALEAAAAAVRRGAFDFVLRPFFVEDISLTVACAAARRQRTAFEIPLGHIRKNCDLLR